MRTPTWRCNRKLMAAGIKLASYQVTDPFREGWTEEQFHLTYNNTLIAALKRSTVEFLKDFLQQHEQSSLPCQEGGAYSDRIVMFKEDQDNEQSFIILHIYEDNEIRARMSLGHAKLIVGFLEDPKLPKETDA